MMFTSATYHAIYSDLIFTDLYHKSTFYMIDGILSYFVITLPISYLGRWPERWRSALSFMAFSIFVVAFDRVENDSNFNKMLFGSGMLVICVAMYIFYTIISIVRACIVTKCGVCKILKAFRWGFAIPGIIFIAAAVTVKMNDYRICYSLMHSSWHSCIMLGLFFALLSKNEEVVLDDYELLLSKVYDGSITYNDMIQKKDEEKYISLEIDDETDINNFIDDSKL